MELRAEARAVAMAVLITVAVKHGTLTVTDSGINSWQYTDIQQLTLTPRDLRVLTYEKSKRRLGRDREYKFEQLAPGEANRLAPIFEQHLGQRFVSAVPPGNFEPLWELAVRDGMLRVGTDRIVVSRSKDSRTWRYSDIQNVSSSGPFNLTFTTFENNNRTFRLQLKE